METLPTEFKGRGSQNIYQFTQVHRQGNVALYKKIDIETGSDYYETIIIKSHNGITYGNGVYQAPKELYPSDISFGTTGWAYKTYDSALTKYNALLQHT